MSVSYRLLSCLAAGALTVALTPAAFAADAVSHRSSKLCGASPQDFDGGFRDVQYPEVGYLFNTTTEGTVTVYYRGQSIDQGTAAAADGVLTWTQDGNTYTSTSIDCTDLLQPARVTDVVAKSPDEQDAVSLARAL